jgi:hypothetical protein
MPPAAIRPSAVARCFTRDWALNLMLGRRPDSDLLSTERSTWMDAMVWSQRPKTTAATIARRQWEDDTRSIFDALTSTGIIDLDEFRRGGSSARTCGRRN